MHLRTYLDAIIETETWRELNRSGEVHHRVIRAISVSNYIRRRRGQGATVEKGQGARGARSVSGGRRLYLMTPASEECEGW